MDDKTALLNQLRIDRSSGPAPSGIRGIWLGAVAVMVAVGALAAWWWTRPGAVPVHVVVAQAIAGDGPAAAPSPAIARAVTTCTGIAPGLVHHQAARAAKPAITAAAPSQIRPLPVGAGPLPRSMRSWLSRAVLSSMRCLCRGVAIPRSRNESTKARPDANSPGQGHANYPYGKEWISFG